MISLAMPNEDIIRYHVSPRTDLDAPSDEDCPVPTEYLTSSDARAPIFALQCYGESTTTDVVALKIRQGGKPLKLQQELKDLAEETELGEEVNKIHVVVFIDLVNLNAVEAAAELTMDFINACKVVQQAVGMFKNILYVGMGSGALWEPVNLLCFDVNQTMVWDDILTDNRIREKYKIAWIPLVLKSPSKRNSLCFTRTEERRHLSGQPNGRYCTHCDEDDGKQGPAHDTITKEY